MRLPFRYAVRNLFRDPVRLAQTVAGSALVVLLVMGAEMLNRGMRETLRATGSPRNVILLGAGSEESVQHAGPQSGVEVVHVGPEFAQRARWPVREAP